MVTAESERGRAASIVAVREGDLGLLAGKRTDARFCEGKSLDCCSKNVTRDAWTDTQCGCLVLGAL